MLEEQPAKPDREGLRRRGFRGDWIEALLTYDATRAVCALHLTYLAPYRGVFVLQWTPAKGHEHYRVVYVSGGAETVTCPDAECYGGAAPELFDRQELRDRVFVAGTRLEADVRDFLLKTIEAYPHELLRCGFCKERPADCGCSVCGLRACIKCVRGDAFLGGLCKTTTLHPWTASRL